MSDDGEKLIAPFYNITASELPLAQGLDYERQLFHASFGTNDQKEGMSAFVEKRKPSWSHT